MLNTARWCIGLFCLTIFFAISGMNIWIILRQWKNPQGQSLAPILGGVFGALGVAVLPISGLAQYSWAPLFLDPGCAPYLILAAMQSIWNRG